MTTVNNICVFCCGQNTPYGNNWSWRGQVLLFLREIIIWLFPEKAKKGNLVSHICFRLRAATSSVKIDRLSRHLELWNINVILVIFFNSHGGLCLKVETVCNLYLLLLRLSLKYYIHSQGRRFFLRTSLRTSLAESLGDYNVILPAIVINHMISFLDKESKVYSGTTTTLSQL